MSPKSETYRDRVAAGVPTLAVHALLAFALLRSLGAGPLALPPEMLELIDLSPPPKIEARPRAREKSRRPEGAASPPNLESRRTEIVAPPPVIPPLPPTVITAPLADIGTDPSAGSATRPGPGTGSGGEGTGTGNGDRGDGPGGGGDGDGDGDGDLTPPRLIRGRIRDGDYPAAAGEAGLGGTVSVIYTVEPDGRATHCRITNSSGSPELDATTCRLIETRFRFAPSRNRFGRPIRSRIVQDHIWEVEDIEEPEPAQPARRRRW